MKKSIQIRMFGLIQKYWISLWILIVSLSLASVGIVYASYNKTNTAKSVVARVGAVGKHFSSNYLQRGSAMMDVPLYVNETDTEPGDYVRIFNFAQGNPGDPYRRQITYNLKMRLVYFDGTDFVNATEAVVQNRYISAECNGTTYTFGKTETGYSNLNGWTTISCSLAGNTASTDTVKVTYSSDQVAALTENAPLPALEKLYLEMIAEPNPPELYLDIEKIQARLDLKLNSTVVPVTWNGYFNDEGAKNAAAGEPLSASFEGFNYVIEGVGEGTFTISWNSEYLALNQNFITARGATPVVSDGISTITFTVDSNTTSRYDTQFYRTGANDPADTWGALKGYVSYTFASGETGP